MLIKEKIIEFLKDKPQATLKEIYEGTGITQNSVRGILNMEVKNSGSFERVGKGTYKLKITTIQSG